MSRLLTLTDDEYKLLIGRLRGIPFADQPLLSLIEKVLDVDRDILYGGHLRCVMQEWTLRIPMMQQTVLLTAIRGPDGTPKYGAAKDLIRWFRRCVLLSAMDGKVLGNPYDMNGGSFTGSSLMNTSCVEFHTSSTPVIEGTDILDWRGGMDRKVGDYIAACDAIPHHFQLHLMHAVEIVGYKHPDRVIREWWKAVYFRLVNDLHLHPESEDELDRRLGDTRAGWLERADPATTT